MSRRFELLPAISQVHATALKAGPEHCDLYGHVNNAAYMVLLEEARWDMIGSGGWTAERVAAERKGPVILDARLRFKREVEQGEALRAETWAVESGERLFTLQQRLRKAGGEDACLAEFVFCFFDLELRRMVPPPQSFREAMRLLPAQGQG
jgi:acyl-CoA thioester hydrolase